MKYLIALWENPYFGIEQNEGYNMPKQGFYYQAYVVLLSN